MCMYYICSCTQPFASQRAESAARSALSGVRPPLDDVKATYPESLIACIVAGWEHQAKSRPSATKMSQWLLKIKRAMGGECGLQSILNKTSALIRPAVMLLGRTSSAEPHPGQVVLPSPADNKLLQRSSMFLLLQKSKEASAAQVRSQSMVVQTPHVPPSPKITSVSPTRNLQVRRVSLLESPGPSPKLGARDKVHKILVPLPPASSPKIGSVDKHYKALLQGTPVSSPKLCALDRLQKDHFALDLERLSSADENDAVNLRGHELFAGGPKSAASSFDKPSAFGLTRKVKHPAFAAKHRSLDI